MKERSLRSFPIVSKHSLDTTMGAVDFQSIGYYTLVFVSCDSVRVDARSQLLLGQRMFFKRSFGTGLGNGVGTPPDTT